MKKYMVLLALCAPLLQAAGRDDPLLFMLQIDKFELQNPDDQPTIALEADAWLGYDLNKLWFKVDVEKEHEGTEAAELQALYSRAIAPYWDVQIGWRHDFKPQDEDYLALAVKGLAPYLFETDAGLYIGSSGQVNFNLQAEYEYLFTQRLVFSPEFEINLYTKDDEDMGIGSGLADIELGLRLRYEIKREFAPYIGINWFKKFGQTADYAEAEGGKSSDTQFVLGFRIWL